MSNVLLQSFSTNSGYPLFFSVRARERTTRKRKPKRIIAPIYKAELELYLFELQMIAEALEMSEKRRTD